MLIQWMAYATLFAAFAYGTAVAFERVATIWNVGQRLVWFAALVVAALMPALLATRTAHHTTNRVTNRNSGDGSATRSVVVFETPIAPRAVSTLEKLESRAIDALQGLDPFVGGLWLSGSLLWIGVLIRAGMIVNRQRSRWRTVTLDGAHVFVAPNLGPAVIGALKPRVIIPEWALSLEPEARALMLRHESEHIRARDPLMVFAGALLVAVFPWNPALWMLVRRLRLAIEIDCDARVLQASPRQREYGILLLTVGARHTAPMPFATSLVERRPFLERRIRAMTNTRPRNPRLMSIVFAGAAMIVLTAAVRTPRPQPLSAQTSSVATRVSSVKPAVASAYAAASAMASAEAVPARASVGATLLPAVEPVRVRAAASASSGASTSASGLPASASRAVATARGRSLTDEEIRALIAAHYPSVLKGDPNINLITFVIDAKGEYVASSSAYQPPLTQADRERAEVNAARDVVVGGEMRGRGGRGSVVVQGYSTATDSIKATADRAAVRDRLMERMVGDSIIVNGSMAMDGQRVRSTIIASGMEGTMSGAIMAGKDTLVAIGSPTSLLNGLRLDANSIDNVEVVKGAGRFGPSYVGVIVIQLK